jgi:hypothetical protein
MTRMGELRDYVAWHEAYDDPDSGLSWRLRTVQELISQALDDHPGPVRVLSLCAGDGRDLIGVLAAREDATRVSGVLVELHPEIAARARDAAAGAGLAGIDVRTIDAAMPAGYADAVPADLVLLVGIFGNISTADLRRTIAAAPQLCAPGAALLWSRGRDERDLGDEVRGWFADAGFDEIAYRTRDSSSRPALGAVRYFGPPVPLRTSESPLFTFLR